MCEANRFRYKGNWKLAYDNSCDGYHVAYSHRSLLETENRFAGENAKGMAYYRNSPDTQPMYMRYTGHGNHFKDKRPNLEKRSGGLWALESAHPGMEHYEAEFIRRYGDRAFALLDLAAPSRSTSTFFRTSPCSATISRYSSRSASRKPTPSGTAP